MAKAVPMETAPSEAPAAKAKVIPAFDALIAIHMQLVLQVDPATSFARDGGFWVCDLCYKRDWNLCW